MMNKVSSTVEEGAENSTCTNEGYIRSEVGEAEVASFEVYFVPVEGDFYLDLDEHFGYGVTLEHDLVTGEAERDVPVVKLGDEDKRDGDYVIDVEDDDDVVFVEDNDCSSEYSPKPCDVRVEELEDCGSFLEWERRNWDKQLIDEKYAAVGQEDIEGRAQRFVFDHRRKAANFWKSQMKMYEQRLWG